MQSFICSIWCSANIPTRSASAHFQAFCFLSTLLESICTRNQTFLRPIYSPEALFWVRPLFYLSRECPWWLEASGSKKGWGIFFCNNLPLVYRTLICLMNIYFSFSFNRIQKSNHTYYHRSRSLEIDSPRKAILRKTLSNEHIKMKGRVSFGSLLR